MHRNILAAAILCGVSACSTLPESGSSEASGYQQRCGGCHEAVQPKAHHQFQWERLLTLMERGVLHREMQPPLSGEEKTALLAYLKRHAKPDPVTSEIGGGPLQLPRN